jgi:peptidoglycan hydrolase-like protein with peptidoglycan-binding domain
MLCQTPNGDEDGDDDYLIGGRSSANRALNRRLSEHGVLSTTYWPSLLYDIHTTIAIIKFQRISGILDDGHPGRDTLAALDLPDRMSFRLNGNVNPDEVCDGFNNDSIWNVQIALMRLGFSIPGGPTAFYNPAIHIATRIHQEKNLMEQTGMLDPETLRSIGLNPKGSIVASIKSAIGLR